MSSSPITPAILRRLEGKADPEVIAVIRLLGEGLENHDQAFVALKNQQNKIGTTASTASTTASAAVKAAASAQSTANTAVSAGAVNYQSANYTLQQSDNQSAVVLQGSTALTVTLAANAAPFMSHIINASSATATLSPLTGTLTGSASLSAGASIHVYFDGYNWVAG